MNDLSHPRAALFAGILDANRVAEGYLLAPPPAIPEIELQARWFAGEFGREFTTTDGRHVKIIQFGEWNHADGPDFSNAAVQIDHGEIALGPIEIDPKADDWEKHGHATNPAYNDVLLHVFFERPTRDFYTRTSAHRNVPQILLDPATIESQPLVDVPSAVPGRCSRFLTAMTEAEVDRMVESAAFFRLVRKALQLVRAMDAHGADQAIFQALAVALGYARNKLPFLLLAQKLPLKALQREPSTIEARLFGTSGFLERLQSKATPPSDATYVKSLWADWWKVRASLAPAILRHDVWTLAGARPANHPQRRLAVLAAIACRWREFRKALDTGGATAALDWLSSLNHPYWSHHYTLTSKPSPTPLALLGDNRLLEIQTNILIPFLHLHDRQIEKTFLETPAPLVNRHVKTAAIRLFAARHDLAHRYLHTVAGQQGLLEIYKHFCQRDLSDCAKCPFPESLQ